MRPWKKLWGYSSETARHRKEGKDPGPEEVQLAVHAAAAVVEYLSRKFSVPTLARQEAKRVAQKEG